MVRKNIFYVISVACVLRLSVLFACTTAIVSGKFTPDGRPLLFKHRDTGKLQNKLMFFTDGKYEYIGLVNSEDSLGNEIWAGCNSAGFAIMNSASYNLNLNDTTNLKDREGFVMKQALKSCATLEDFESLLKKLPKPLGVEANFGIIDAKGGAAYYETGNFDFLKIDANDPTVAPFGYIIRTNYSFARNQDKGYGYIRYSTAEELFYQAAAANDLTFEFIIKRVSRCLKHSLTTIDLTESIPKNDDKPQFVGFQDFIPRYSSASTVVVQGVRADESPEFATMWTILGFQLCSVAVPTWVKGRNPLPEILKADETGNAPLCDMALTLKKKCFPIQRGSGSRYLNLSALLNRDATGILQKLKPLEFRILKETDKKLKTWRKNGIEPTEIQKYYHWLDETVMAEYEHLFGL